MSDLDDVKLLNLLDKHTGSMLLEYDGCVKNILNCKRGLTKRW